MFASTILAALLLNGTSTPTTELWNGVHAGMTVEQVRALFPEADAKRHSTEIEGYEPIEGCESEVHIKHRGGVVDEVEVEGAGSIGGKCANQVYTALLAKYGQPHANGDIEHGMLTGSTLLTQGDEVVWSLDGVTMTFKRYSNQGLFGASWKMIYTTAGADIGL